MDTPAQPGATLADAQSDANKSNAPAPVEIQQLSTSVINKIAAGEVIERPASVVKELMENSVDARATRVDVSLGQGGMELIRVADNGCGMEPSQFGLAFSSNATSKIRDADDLFSVQSMGFRGEALASIAEISSLRLRSRTHFDDSGAELEITGGQPDAIVPCGCAPGTTIEVRSLFYNTPVRRKFMRKPQTEFGHAAEAFARIALPRPDIHFTLRHNDRLVHDLPPVENWRERIGALFSQDLADNLIWVEDGDEAIRLSGFVADPQLSRSNNRMQYLFLNGRHIRDRALQHALTESYRGLLLTGRHPIAFLRLELAPDTVDVNVHPTKLEVRFQDSGRAYSLVLSSIRRRFLSNDLTARVGGRAESEEAAPAQPIQPSQAEEDSRNSLQWARTPTQPAVQPSLPLQSPELSERSAAVLESLAQRTTAPTGLAPGAGSGDAATAAGGELAPAGGGIAPDAAPVPGSAEAEWGPSDSLGATPTPAKAAAPKIGMQIQNRYLVTETDEGMIVIDQHALHERILYERFRERALRGSLEKQPMLQPDLVTLAPKEMAAVLEQKELLGQLGLDIESFGHDTIAVNSHPAMMRTRPSELLRQSVELMMDGGRDPERRDLLDELLHMMSCKAAVKAGDPLSPDEVTALLEQRDLCQDAHHCPHGRPTALIFTPEQLDRQFQRT